MTRLWIALAAAALTLAAACAPADDAAEPEAETESSALAAGAFDRVAIARMYVEGERTVASVGPATMTVDDYASAIADDLAKLKPTYVSGLIRKNNPVAKGAAALTPDEIRAFGVVRRRLPHAKLDVALTTQNPGGALTKDELLGLMKNIDDAIHPDGWFFDFFTSGDPEAVAAAVRWAHARHEAIGGNYFASPSNPNGTDKADFFSVPDDDCGHLDQDKIDRLRARFGKPILVHINNNAQNDDTNTCGGKKGTLSCTYMKDWSNQRRSGYLDERASGQKSGHYTYMYNAFFPACPLKDYYDASADKAPGSQRSMLQEMVQAADRFNR